jgi:hypothetical protein
MNDAVPRRGGSVPGKEPNKNHRRDTDALLLHSDYFAGDATNTPKEFRWRFRMNKDLFMKIVQGMGEYNTTSSTRKIAPESGGSRPFRNARQPYGALHMELRRSGLSTNG